MQGPARRRHRLRRWRATAPPGKWRAQAATPAAPGRWLCSACSACSARRRRRALPPSGSRPLGTAPAAGSGSPAAATVRVEGGRTAQSVLARGGGKPGASLACAFTPRATIVSRELTHSRLIPAPTSTRPQLLTWAAAIAARRASTAVSSLTWDPAPQRASACRTTHPRCARVSASGGPAPAPCATRAVRLAPQASAAPASALRPGPAPALYPPSFQPNPPPPVPHRAAGTRAAPAACPAAPTALRSPVTRA